MEKSDRGFEKKTRKGAGEKEIQYLEELQEKVNPWKKGRREEAKQVEGGIGRKGGSVRKLEIRKERGRPASWWGGKRGNFLGNRL